MNSLNPVNLFYEEPDNDRWFYGDRYPRRILRRLVRGRPPVGGHKRTFLNLCAGLRELGVSFRVNDYRYARLHPEEGVCIVGKTHVLDKVQWRNPLVIGSSIYSHPSDDPGLLQRLPIRKIIVKGPWMRKMCEPYWGDKVVDWAGGIDTEYWSPVPDQAKDIDVLLYDKVMWDYDRKYPALVAPMLSLLEKKGLRVVKIRYGGYKGEDFRSLLRRSRVMIFLSEHETQGHASLEALSCGVPLLAWDEGGYWIDPSYYPHKEKFSPVSSVPYWDDRCGMKFKTLKEFSDRLGGFLEKCGRGEFRPAHVRFRGPHDRRDEKRADRCGRHRHN